MGYSVIFEATFTDLSKKQEDIVKLHPEFLSRVSAVYGKGGIRMVGMDERGWDFKVKSVTSHDKKGSPEYYDVRVDFLGVKEVLNYYSKNKSLWKKEGGLNVRSLAGELMYNIDVKIKCSCPADLYWGGAYIRSQSDLSAYPDPGETRPPVERNPNKYGAHCKHIQAVVNLIGMYIGTFSKWLKKYFGEYISEVEKSIRKQDSVNQDRVKQVVKNSFKTEAERRSVEKTSE